MSKTQEKSTVIRIIQLFKNRKKTVLFLVLLVLFATGFEIAIPVISQKLIDRFIEFLKSGGPAPTGFLIASAVGILIATVAGRALQSLYNYHLFKVVTSVEDEVRHAVFEKYLRLHVLFHHSSSSGQIIGRIDRGAQGIYAVSHDIFGHSLIPPFVIFVGILSILLFKSPLIALVIFLPLPLYLLSVRNLTEKIYHIEKVSNDRFEEISKEAYDVAGNVLTVKKFSQEEKETDNQSSLRAAARATQYSAERLWSVLENIQTVLATVGRIGVIMLGGFFVLRGEATIGEFVLYIALQNMAYSPLSQLSIIFPRLRRNTARAERLFMILDEPVHVMDKPDAKMLSPFSRSIEFKNVSFRYGEAKHFALRGVNMTIPRGSTVALVGRSGSGKTTFINTLLRSYDPTEGAIVVDGFDLRDIARGSLLDQIAVVPQEVDLFSRSISENIAYGKLDIKREDVVSAAQTALAHDFIEKMEKGYDTLVGERGIKLSGGERQRIGIARAVLRDPKILILDEATSHLDTESERLITEATNALTKNRTTIIIAHRLSTVLSADIIVVFKNGEIEAQGKHEELLKTSPTYQKLHALQFRNNV